MWDWETEGTILRAKAFSQEVMSVAFSPFFPGQLVSSGTGHIRFWKMASTFTGLKLQVRRRAFLRPPNSFFSLSFACGDTRFRRTG